MNAYNNNNTFLQYKFIKKVLNKQIIQLIAEYYSEWGGGGG